MKRAIALSLVLFIMFTACACNSDGSADIWIFAEGFNDQSNQYKIELSEVSAVTTDGLRTYECFIDVGDGKKILLTLNAADDGTITSLSVTSASGDKVPTDIFCAVSKTAAVVLTQETGEDVSSALEALGMTRQKNNGKNAASYYKTTICRFSLVTNEEGTAFIAELIKYLESTSEPLSLRVDGGNTEAQIKETTEFNTIETTGNS